MKQQSQAKSWHTDLTIFKPKNATAEKHKALKCSTAGTNSTFSVVHGPEHPLVVGLLYEHPITTHTIRGVGSESLLHRHAVSYQNHTEASAGSEAMMLCTSTFSYCLKHCFSLRAPGVKWECSSHWFSSWTCSLSSPYLHLLSLTFNAAFFFHHLLQNACLQAAMSETFTTERSAGKILLLVQPCYLHPDPTHEKTLTQHPPKPELRPQFTLFFAFLILFSV